MMRVVQEECLCDHRPPRPVHRPRLRHGHLSPWAPPPPRPTDVHMYPLCHLKCHCCPSEYCHISAVLLSKSWGCLMMCEFPAPREGTVICSARVDPFPPSKRFRGHCSARFSVTELQDVHCSPVFRWEEYSDAIGCLFNSECC